jgi:hypothetical protein
MSSDDRYLWDRAGPVDPDVRALENLLGRFAHDGRPFGRAGSSVRARRWLPLLVASAGLAATWLLVPLLVPTTNQGDELELTIAEVARRLGRGEWFVATETARRLELGRLGDLTLEPGSRLQVRQLSTDLARLFLEEGRLEAFVAADAKPRFFQVDTPSTRCVDLGCKYTLSVDSAGDTHVAVTMGEVAFETDAGDVFVPRGAECVARRSTGLGTPRFRNCSPELRVALDALDSLPRSSIAERRVAAQAVVGAVTEPRDSLSLWHLLRDGCGEIVILAEERLVALVGAPVASGRGGTIDHEAWRRHLDPHWW